MPTSGKQGSLGKAEIVRHAGKGAQTLLPKRGALNDLVGSQMTINDYSKAGRNIAYNGPSLTDPQKQ